MALPSTLIQRGLRSAQPAATLVAAGTIYYVTDELVTERSNGTTWDDISDGGQYAVGGAASSTDNAIVRWDGTGGTTIQNSAVTIADTTGVVSGLVFPNTGLKVQDTDSSHNLIIAPGTNITADRTATVYTGDTNVSVTLPIVGTIGCTIDEGGSAITTGVKGYVEVPYAGTITGVTMLADTSTTTVVDIWVDSYANWPPTDADSITAAAPPTITAALKSQDTTLTGWTTSFAAGAIFAFNVDSNNNATELRVFLQTKRT